MENITVKKFNLDFMHAPINALCIGRRRSGKTILALDLIRTNFKDHNKIVFSCTEEYEKKWEGADVHGELTEVLVEKIVKDSSERKSGSVVIMELPLERTLRTNFYKMSKVSKAVNLNIIHLVSYYCGISPQARSELDFLFLFTGLSKSELNRIYQDFCSFVSFDEFYKIFDKCAHEFDILVVDLTKSSKNIEDRFFWFKANFSL